VQRCELASWACSRASYVGERHGQGLRGTMDTRCRRKRGRGAPGTVICGTGPVLGEVEEPSTSPRDPRRPRRPGRLHQPGPYNLANAQGEPCDVVNPLQARFESDIRSSECHTMRSRAQRQSHGHFIRPMSSRMEALLPHRRGKVTTVTQYGGEQ
jgi:hypothetical protein